MIEALKLIAARSPAAAREALACIRAISAGSPIVQLRYNRVAELAFGDPAARFSAAERALIAEHIEQPGGGDEPGELRSEIIRLRLTPSERATVTTAANAAGQTVSEYIRRNLGL